MFATIEDEQMSEYTGCRDHNNVCRRGKKRLGHLWGGGATFIPGTVPEDQSIS